MRTTLIFAAALLVATQALAADAAKAPSKPVEEQAGMASYSMSGMSGEQKRGLAKAVKRQNKQLGHGMAGLGEAPGKPAKKDAKADR